MSLQRYPQKESERESKVIIRKDVIILQAHMLSPSIVLILKTDKGIKKI